LHREKDRVQYESADRRDGVTVRSVLTAFVIILALSVVGFYVTLLYFTISSFGTGVPAAAPFAVLFLLATLMTIPAVGRCLALSRRELLTIYAMVSIGAPLVSQSILGWMLPHSIIQHYMARAIPDWETTFVYLIPTWFTPTDPAAVEDFFVGRASVPWALWWMPLVAWCSFLVGVVVASTCLTVLVRQQWAANERLSFPLAQIPLETVAEADAESGRSAARLRFGWMFWAGLLISFGIGFYNSLAGWVPALPSIPIGPVTLMQWQRVGPLAGLGDIDLVLWPWLIALAYLIPKELSFSCWFFWWFRVGLTVLAIAAGAFPQRPEEWYGNTFPAPYWQGVGAVLALGGWTAWTARRHLARAIRIAFSRASGRADAEEPMPYRWALAGFAVSFGWLVYFCWLAGSRVPVGVALVVLILVFYLMWARLRAETGMGFLSFPLKVDNVMLEPIGSTIYRPREVITILSARWSYFPGYGQSPEVFCGNALESMKIAEAAHIRQRPLLAAMGLGFLVALGFGVYLVMTGIYHFGFHAGLRAGTSQDWWLDQQLRIDGARIFNNLNNPTQFDLFATIAIGAGAAFTVFLGLMRQRFWWWPFHPIGYMASNTWGMKWNWQPFLVGWLAKTVVIRYGGLRLYRRTVSLAIGLIGGDLLNQVAWGIIQAISQAAA
jgi:hypothetical protein